MAGTNEVQQFVEVDGGVRGDRPWHRSIVSDPLTSLGDRPLRPDESLRVNDRLIVRGAREHNLKDVNLDLPRDAMIVFTGLSGSGKSSLAFDTIFAEGQRRYVESLSAYARQFLGQMDKPDVDFIEGLSPAVSIDQKSTSRNPRSTVGTITEVYDYLRLLWARIGKPHCPVCGEPIAKQTPQQIVDRILEMPEGTRFQVLAPVIRERKGEYVDLFGDLQIKGFARVRVDGVVYPLTDPPKLKKQEKHTIEAVVDRLVARPSSKQRITDSIETALDAGRRPGHPRLRRPRRGRPAPRAPLLRAAGLPQRPPAGHRRARTAVVLVQLAVRRLPGVHRSRHPQGGRPRAGRPRPRADPARRGDRARGRPGRPASTSCGCCRASATRSGSTSTRRGSSWARGAEGGAARHRRPGARQLPQPLRPQPVLLRQLRGRGHLDRAPLRRDRVRLLAREVRGLHARGAVPDVRRHPAQARDPGRHGARPLDRRAVLAVDRRGERLAAAARARRPREADRRAGAQGDPRPARLPRRRRAALPLARPRGGHAGRRRGAAHPAGHPDRLRAGRRALRARRAVHRAAPARQPPADRDPGPAQEPRQHADRRRARRGHHPHRRLGGRHRPGGRRARRPDRGQRHGRGPARVGGVDHRRLPVRAAGDRGAARCAVRARPAASWSSRARASTTCATSTSPSRWAASSRSPASAGRASRPWSTTSCTPRWPTGSTAPSCRRGGTSGCAASTSSTRSSASTSRRSAARRGRTRRPTPACSTTSASCSARPPRPRSAATSRAGSRSTSRAAAARTARATARSRSR